MIVASLLRWSLCRSGGGGGGVGRILGTTVRILNAECAAVQAARLPTNQICRRFRIVRAEKRATRPGDVVMYVLGTAILFLGITYASVPIYRIFCQKTGAGGDMRTATKAAMDIEKMSVISDRLIRVRFSGDSNMAWKFSPVQDEIMVHPGETALAFYTAFNPSKKPLVGIATYNVLPAEAGLYFVKVQCFCFEEQLINPGEAVDLPVFFYLDPDYAKDPRLERVDDIVLNYVFFESKDGLELPQPVIALPFNGSSNRD